MTFPIWPRNRRIRRAFLLSALLLAFFAGGVSGQTIDSDQLHGVMKLIKKARHNLVYQGTMVISRDGTQRQAKYQVWAHPPAIYHLERIEMPGEKRSAGVQGRRRSERRGEMPEASLFPQRKFLNLFRQNYSFSLEESDFIAGRSSSLLTIAPNHMPRFGMRIWFDRLNHFILKREIVYFSESGESTSFRQEFHEIAFVNALPDSIVAVANKREPVERRRDAERDRITTLNELVQKVDIVAFAPDYVPRGCELASVDYREDKKRKIIHLNYTDGLLNFSIFEIQGKPPSWMERYIKWSERPRRGHGFRQLIAARKDETQFLLLGNFDREELRKIVESMNPISQ